MLRSEELAVLEREIVSCRRCPRLVAWREEVAREKRASFRDEVYWGRPVPGFGDLEASIVIFGLAPAAHGANRTGRIFTGDRSGDFLFASLHRTGFANKPVSRRRGDGLRLSGLWISAAVRCAPPQNRPTPDERDACLPYAARELEALDAKVVVCLGAFAWDAALRLLGKRPKPKFAHGAECEAGSLVLIGCYHHRSRTPLPECSPPRCSTPSCRGQDPGPWSYPEPGKATVLSDRMDARGFL